MPQKVLSIKGKASKVFDQLAYMARVAGNVTLKELAWNKGIIAK